MGVNKSLLKNVYSYYVSGQNLECNFPVVPLSNSLYTLTYRIGLVVANTGNVKVSIESGTSHEIFSDNVQANTLTFITITITTPNNSGDQMKFTCGTKSVTVTGYKNNANKIKFSANSQVYISNYYITVFLNGNTPYTKSGLSSCNNDDDCLRGYMCSSGKCLKCHSTCSSCSLDASSTVGISSCKSCNTLTDSSNDTPNAGKCRIDYIDISQFEDISFETKAPHANRVTLGVWIFISDLAVMGQKRGIVHIVVKNFFILSIISAGTEPTAYLNVYEKYTSGLGDQTTSDGFTGQLGRQTNLKRIIILNVGKTDEKLNTLSGRWFFIQGAMSFDNKQFYLFSIVNGKQSTKIETLEKELLYTGVTSDEYFRTIYRAGENQQILIRNGKSTGAKFYMRNLVFFRELIPPSILYMYHDMSKIITTEDIYPEVRFVLPFTDLLINANTYQIKGGGVYQSTIIKLTTTTGFDLSPPTNFKQLPLNTLQNLFSTVDFSTEKAITSCPNSGLCYDDNKPINCNSWMTTSFTCADKCDTNYIPYIGVSKKKGYCAYPCVSSMKCYSDTEDNFVTTNNFCNAPNYNLYYKCTDQSKNYAMYYSPIHTPQTIRIPVGTYKSYIVEIWYYPDYTQDFKEVYTPLQKQFVFCTNVMQIYYDNLQKAQYFFSSNQGEVQIQDDKINRYEWNKFMLVSKFENNQYTLYGLINNDLQTIYGLGTPQGNTGFELTHVIFCEGCTIGNFNVKWGSGFYKNLRIWDGDKTSVSTLIQYDQYYPNYKPRVDAIHLQYPLSKEYFRDNTLTDPNIGADVNVNKDYDIGDHLQLWNYCSTFDYVEIAHPSLGKHVKSLTTNPVTMDCPAGCARCWDDDTCFSCKSNFFLTTNSRCNEIKNYYFKSPSTSQTPQAIKIVFDGINSEELTISFWIKLFGFSKYPSEIVSFSTNLKLYYQNDQAKDDYGLNVIYTAGTDKSLVVVPSFREKFGDWAYISLANYDSVSRSNYFPKIMKFEIDADSYPINYNIITGQTVSIQYFSISENVYALFYGVKLFTNFIVGNIGYELSKATIPSPFSRPTLFKGIIYFPKGTTNANCYDSQMTTLTSQTYECVPDYDNRLEEVNHCPDINQFLIANVGGGFGQCSGKCRNSCYQSGDKQCTCLMKNSNSQMFMRNNNAHYCKRFDYINWAMAEDVKIDNVLTAKMTKKYTMHFWVFAYSYVKGKFGGLEFLWNGHNKITLTLSDAAKNEYTFECIPYYTDGNPPIKSGKTLSTKIIINKWNFLSCAVDYITEKFYLNTNNDNPASLTEDMDTTIPSTILTSNQHTYLSIKDKSLESNEISKEEWGVLFYRQIRLWTEAYFSAEFLSRIWINTPSLFPYLANAWEPTYDGTDTIHDIATIATSVTIVNKGKLGTNVVEDDDYVILTMCSENGEYYDTSTEKCLQFTDLSKMKDFEFTDVPVSYSGNYAMAFWIFTEDYNELVDGVHIQWSKHLQISVVKVSLLNAMCFPQGYYADLIDNTNINGKYSSVLNKGSVELKGTSGVWLWVLCSVSNYNQKFLINDENPIDIIPETLYDSTQSTYPYRYYMSEEGQTSTLKVQNISKTKKIYLRVIELFQDYIPYDYSFKYMDLTKMKFGEFPSLLFVCNFANFNPNTKQVQYTIYKSNGVFTYFKQLDTTTTVTTFELSANFVFLPLCNPENKMKYTANKNICESIVKCDLTTLNARYCMDEETPLSCLVNHFIHIDPNTKAITCKTECPANTIRAPGTTSNQGICNTDCGMAGAGIQKCPSSGSGTLANYPNEYTCNTGFSRINYKCINTNDYALKSAIFVSRCYQSPNIYRSLMSGTKANFASGYLLEFWFKLDTILNTCTRNAKKEYYFFAIPHSVYLDTDSNLWYYEIVDTVYKKKLEGVQSYEWNRFVIKTTLGATGQNVDVYVNYKFNSPDVIFTSIPASTNMQLTSISFCSDVKNGDCTPSKIKINWGSAYYRNIRVWDLKSSTTQVIQSYNNGIFTENPKSLILYYPLTIDHIDLNKIDEIISGNENIQATHISTANFRSSDGYSFYNYAINFDWGVEKTDNEAKYIKAMDKTVITSASCATPCKRCYSNAETDCYECMDGFVLVNKKCVQTTQYFLKTPFNNPGNFVSFKITDTGAAVPFDLTNQKGFTLTLWIKFLGVIQGGTSSEPYILKLSENAFLAYEISSTNLIFRNNNIVAFRDTNFQKYIGIWIPIVIANYISNTNNDVYPNMLTLSVNKIDIPFSSGYSIPTSGVSVNQISFGIEIIALYAELRVYNRFIQGAYGTITSKTTTREENIMFKYNLFGSNNNNCLQDGELASNTVGGLGITCVADYNEYLSSTCDDNVKYFDLSITTVEPPCGSCDQVCKTFCFNSGTQSCTCDVTEGYYWLRRHRTTKQTYCEYLPYIDFSELQPIQLDPIPASKTLESTIELWLFVYSYNSANNNFLEINIEWHLHNKITIYNQGNSLYVKCFPLYDMDDSTRYTESSFIGLTFFRWNLIRCGTDIASEKKTFFLNSNSQNLATIDFPTRGDETKAKIYSPDTMTHNFGFVFLREIKFWQQNNFKYIDSSYINMKSYNKWPGLLSYFKTKYSGTYEIYEEIKGTTTLATRKNDYIGYNIVDPNNAGYYSTLNLCEESFVYNSATSTCVTPALTRCEYPGDISDNCISCDEDKKYINPIDGNCVAECPDFYFEHDLINQCRKCYHTCFKCSGIKENECTACTETVENGILYFNPRDHTCVDNCEQHGFTASKTTPYTCVIFDASARLVNYQEGVPIDINTFFELEAEVYGETAPGYTTLWNFEENMTRDANNDPNLVFNGSPFRLGGTDLENLKVQIDNTFFRLDTKYVFRLDIIKSNQGSSVIVPVYFTLTMNSYPKDGVLTIIPKVGLYNTTTFVMTCENWVDDTTTDLEYHFYSIEENTNTIKELSPWSRINEIYSNFTVVYYQQPSNKITVYCEIRDQYNAVATTTTDIIISNSINNGIYSLSDALDGYVMPNSVTPAILLHRSKYLMSLGIDTYKSLQPELLQTKYEPALDQSVVTKRDPSCTSDYCNSNGDCDLVDEFIVCNCVLGYVGRNCHIDKNGYEKLSAAYIELYNKLFSELQNSIDYDQFMTLYNIYFSAQMFYQDTTFFSNNLDTYLTLAMNLFSDSILNNTVEYLDLFDFYYSFELTRLNKDRLANKNSTGYPYRNVSITEDQIKEYSEAFSYISEKLLAFLKYLVNLYKTARKTIIYESKNFYIGITMVNPTFNDVEFFESRRESYKSHVKFMECLNYVEIEKLTNPYYQAWMIYIEYLNFPFGYNSTLSQNHTSPLIELKFIDATTGKDIIVSGCEGDNAMIFSMPFTSYSWLDDLNKQKWLYDPNNYKSPDDPIFSDPIYINASGYISNDTIEERINIYKRLYNFSCNYYDTDLKKFNESGLNYLNFTSDSNFIQFNSTHLTMFTTFFTENIMQFHVLNRFFYLKRPQVFKYWPNYTDNYAFFVIGGFIGLYVLLSIILSLYDLKYFRQESLLEFLKREIVRVFLPYNHEKEKEINKIVPTGFEPGIKPNIIFGEDLIKGRKANLENDKYLNDDFGGGLFDEKDPNNILNLNKTQNDEEEKNNDSGFDEEKHDPFVSTNTMNKPLGNKFFAMTTTAGNENKVMNPFLNENNAVDIHTNIKKYNKNEALDPNSLPEQFENPEDDYAKRLEAFANLNLTLFQFICENMRERHIFISPIINISLFNPRWKKMIMLVSEIATESILIAVQLTADETATTSNIGSLIKISFISMIGADVLMYILALFFYVSYRQRKRLYKIVVSGGQLVVLKEWEEMVCKNAFYTVIGVIINLLIWGFSFYISVSFVAVWSVQASAWLITFIVTFVLDFIVFEFLVEFIIGLFYLKRKNVSCLRAIAEFLNQTRNYRCLWP